MHYGRRASLEKVKQVECVFLFKLFFFQRNFRVPPSGHLASRRLQVLVHPWYFGAQSAGCGERSSVYV
jgi:hypothetical protein